MTVLCIPVLTTGVLTSNVPCKQQIMSLWTVLSYTVFYVSAINLCKYVTMGNIIIYMAQIYHPRKCCAY